MSDIIDFVIDLLSACCMEFRLFLVTLGIGLMVSEHWQIGTDRPAVINTFAVLLIALFAGIFLYRRFWKTTAETPGHPHDSNGT